MIGGAALSAAPALLVQSLRWTEPGKEIDAIVTQPPTCLAFDARNKLVVQAGMALFNTPTLLGGQAAKAGLSCNSCHVNGRDNRYFQLPSLSGTAGTADVSSSFFSAARGNGVHDPVPIPDLAQPGKVSRATGDPALEHFIRNLIVEEFSGREPSQTALSAVANYIRAIRPCEPGDGIRQNRQLSDQLSLINAALDGASAMQRQGDTPTAKLLIGGARHQLGLIDERYAAKRFTAERSFLIDASTRLRKIADADKSSAIPASLDAWRQDFDRKITSRLRAGEPHSLYSRKRIMAAFDGDIAKSK